jgi:MFS family permease
MNRYPTYGTIETDQSRKSVHGTEHVVVSSIDATEFTDGTDVEFDENGVKAWVVLWGCFCSFFAGLSLMNSVGVFQSWISTHQLANVSTGKIGWIFGFYNFFAFFAGIKIGTLFDRYGPIPLSVVGTLLLMATYLLMAGCTEYWHFFLDIGLLGGFSTCLMFTSAIGTVQHWFLKRIGLVIGLAMSGGSVGGVVIPTILGNYCR